MKALHRNTQVSVPGAGAGWTTPVAPTTAGIASRQQCSPTITPQNTTKVRATTRQAIVPFHRAARHHRQFPQFGQNGHSAVLRIRPGGGLRAIPTRIAPRLRQQAVAGAASAKVCILWARRFRKRCRRLSTCCLRCEGGSCSTQTGAASRPGCGRQVQGR